MNTLVPLLVATLVFGLVTAVLIWVVGRFDLGLETNGFGSALVAGLVAAFAAGAVTILLSLANIGDGDGLIGGIVHLVVTAATLWLAGRLLPGLKVKGVAGVLVVAVAIGLVYWLGGQLLAQII
jgi:uncharacterized membrane protein YvlD (DUF360 family)